MKKTIVLFSGGIDSTTALYWAVSKSEYVSAFTVDYGQRHKIEIQAARIITQKLGIPQKIVQVDLTSIGGSALTDKKMTPPEFTDVHEIGSGVPSTYVPFRNGIFLSLAAAWGDVIEADAIVVGFNVIDSPNYPDTRDCFVKAMEKAIESGTKASSLGRKTHIAAPFIHIKKSEIIRQGLSMGVDYSHSISCYAGEEIPCGKCSSCLLRQRAWEEVGRKDPLLQRLEEEEQL